MSDVVVLGSNPSGLALALLLARQRLAVTVLEERDVPGGLFARETFHPGYRAPGLVHGPTRVVRKTIERLQLHKHGLELADHPETVFHAGPQASSDPGLLLEGDPDRAREAIGERWPGDADAYVAWRGFVERVAPIVRSLLERPPPDPFSARTGDLAELFKTAFGVRRLGGNDMLELLRMAPMSAADWFGERFRAPELVAALASRGLRGGPNGPLAPHTAGLCLLAECSGDATVVGGPAALVEALLKACSEAGVELRRGLGIEELGIERGAAGAREVRRVELLGGEVIEARAVVSTLDPRRTLGSLVHPRHLGPGFLAELGGLRARGSTGFVRLALCAPPDFRARPGAEFARAAITGELRALERSFDALKYGALPERPWLDVRVPTRQDPGLAPAGHHVLTAEVHGVPRDLRGSDGGWNEPARARLGELALAQLRRHFELPPETVVALDVVTPADVEERYGLTGGHVLHGEHAFDQLLFLRPSAGCAWYATPIEGLTLAGPGTHPGGFVALGSVPLAQRAVRA